jgi:hypothetical protein
MGAMVINVPVAQADPYAYPYEDGFSTTFWSDFSIADPFGKDAVRDTFNRAFEEWKSDFRYLTDLVIVLNTRSSSTTTATGNSRSSTTRCGGSRTAMRWRTSPVKSWSISSASPTSPTNGRGGDSPRPTLFTNNATKGISS